jgi:hypothetical protein
MFGGQGSAANLTAKRARETYFEPKVARNFNPRNRSLKQEVNEKKYESRAGECSDRT